MIEYAYTPHSELADDDRLRIIALKQQHWPYSQQSQQEWLDRNLTPDDIHVLCKMDGVLAGYCNLVYVKMSAGDICRTAMGIGNVCVQKQDTKHGWGTALVRAASRFISAKQQAGILLCKTELIPFYEQCGWADRTGDYARIEIAGEIYTNRLMAYPAAAELPLPLKATLQIERNF